MPVTQQSLPDVMQQFNAIRDRAQAIAMPNATTEVAQPTTPTESDAVVKRDIYDKKGNVMLTAFSTVGPQLREDFETAYKMYQKYGNRIEGFTFLEPGVQEKLRSLHETYIGQPLRSLASGTEKLPELAQAGSYSEQYDPAVGLYNLIKQFLPGVARSASTPEGTGALAGTAAGAAVTSGTSLVPQIIGTAAGAGLGSLIGDVASGTYQGKLQQRISNVAQEAGMAALGTGFVGAFKTILGRGMSQQANEQVATGLMDLIKTKARPFTNDPMALEAITSSRQGANDVLQVGIKALRGDIDTTRDGFIQTLTPGGYIGIKKAKVPGQFSADQFVSDFSTTAPRALSKETATEVRGYIRQLATKGNDLLDAIVDNKSVATAQSSMQELRQKIQDSVTADFSKNGSTAATAQGLRAKQLVDTYTKQVDNFMDVAEVMSYMKQSIGPRGFDPLLFQKLTQLKGGAQPSSTLDQATDIGFRGASDRLTGTDAPVTLGVPVSSIPGLNRIPLLNKAVIGKTIGQRYIGSVQGQYPITESTAGQQTIKAINDYLESTKKK